jgi:hypothetical protein
MRSYQTNLMVYAAGNYSVKEFATVGAPFQVRHAMSARHSRCAYNAHALVHHR